MLWPLETERPAVPQPSGAVEGYEDLLEESALEHAQRRASSSMEGARSRQLPSPLKTAEAVEELQMPMNCTLADHGGMGGAAEAHGARPPTLSMQAAAYPASTFDLTFKDARLEKAFECSLRPAMLRCDRLVGCAQALLPVIVLLGCLAGSGSLPLCGTFFLLGEFVHSPYLISTKIIEVACSQVRLFSGAVLIVLPTAVSFLRPMWWLRNNHRQHIVASTRIATMAAYAWFVMLQPESGDGSTAQRILVQSGLGALLIGPIRCAGSIACGWGRVC